MANEIFLYWGSGSPPCWRVMIVLEEKGLGGYPNKLISFEKKEHKTEEVMKLNPRGQVPTLKVGDLVINESIAACLFLEDAYNQGTKLMPDDLPSKALAYQRMNEVANLQRKAGEDLIYLYMRNKAEDLDQDLLKTRKEAFIEELTRWDKYLEEQGDQSYIAGKEFSLADCVFFPNLAFVVRVGMKLDGRFPRLASYYTRVSERPSVEASWPPHFKTTPPKTFLAEV